LKTFPLYLILIWWWWSYDNKKVGLSGGQEIEFQEIETISLKNLSVD